MKLIWHPLALADRESIMDFIACDKPLSALALDENFDIHADRIEANPYLYRPGRVPGTREAVVHPNYVLVYRIEHETITILRVLHAAQRWPAAGWFSRNTSQVTEYKRCFYAGCAHAVGRVSPARYP